MKKWIVWGIGFLLVAFTGVWANGPEPFFFFNQTELKALKNARNSQSEAVQQALNNLQHQAEQLMRKGPWSVTDYKSPAVSGNPHDYFSESPYWWPNPEDPNGPYIRKDGLRNPERFMAHKNALKDMSTAVSVLSVAAWLFDEPRYAQRAREVLQVWFVNAETRMNPHLNYAQAIRNRSAGRGVGIIDTHCFIFMLETLNFLQASGYWPAQERAQLEDWFKDYLTWLTTSKNGTDEKHQGNNHTTWWCAQVAGVSNFTGQKTMRDSLWQFVKREPLQLQFEADGRMPEELARTKSYSYCQFNLNAWSLLCTLADRDGQNFWTLLNAKGGSVDKAIDFLVPYLKDFKSWPYKQIVPPRKRPPLMLYLAGRALPDKGYHKIYAQSLLPKQEMGNYSGDVLDYMIRLLHLSRMEE